MAIAIVTTDSIRTKKIRPEPIKRYLTVKDDVVIPANSFVGVLNGVAEPVEANEDGGTYDFIVFSLHRVDTTGETGYQAEFYENIEVEFTSANSLASVNVGENVYLHDNVSIRADNDTNTRTIAVRMTEKTSSTSAFVRVGIAT